MDFDADVVIAEEVRRWLARGGPGAGLAELAGEDLVLSGRGARIPLWDDDPE